MSAERVEEIARRTVMETFAIVYGARGVPWSDIKGTLPDMLVGRFAAAAQAAELSGAGVPASRDGHLSGLPGGRGWCSAHGHGAHHRGLVRGPRPRTDLGGRAVALPMTEEHRSAAPQRAVGAATVQHARHQQPSGT